jgi:tRNA-Thr(GGU) m(6)t(6)A37 methyltransferase TsaA
MISEMITLIPIGTVRSSRVDLADDNWDAVGSRIELTADFDADALSGIEDFSHAEIIFQFDRVDESKVERKSRHPRGNTAWPKVGIFAQRGSGRPNRIGATIVRVVKREGRVLEVAGLDAADGTPVLDIKPVMRQFLPRGEVRQPSWVDELMGDYWRRS